MVAEQLIVFLLLVLATSSADEDTEAWIVSTPPEIHPCCRDCEAGVPMVCFYTFTVEHYYSMSKACYDCPQNMSDCYRPDCVQNNGIQKAAITVNRQIPGPSIEVCKGDTIVVDLKNEMNDEAVTIHWHGNKQIETPHMDGVPFVTQCPITPNTDFRYVFEAGTPGTMFWHAHTSVQRGEGVFGPLIVRVPDAEDKSRDLYDFDLSEHTIVVYDWSFHTSIVHVNNEFHVSQSGTADSVIVNGRGSFYNDTVRTTDTPPAVFCVRQGYRYRFRMINAGTLDCPVELYIDQHNMSVIASDGYEIYPVKVDSLVSYVGERWDFVLDAIQPVDNYWMRFTAQYTCLNSDRSVHTVAVLHYEGAPNVEPESAVGYDLHPTPYLQLNPLNRANNASGTLCVSELRARDKYDDIVLLEPTTDLQFFIDFDMYAMDHPLYHKRDEYGYHDVETAHQVVTPQLNHVSFRYPHSPLLSQFEDIDPNTLCSNLDLSDCQNTYCSCTTILEVPFNSSVEVVLVHEGLMMNVNHPFHLHGYGFRVVGIDRMGNSTTLQEIKDLDARGELIRNLEDPPFKDTVTVPDGGYTIFRFFATNPGYWFFHCHIEHHLEASMALVFKVGEDHQLPPAPPGFPKCGDFKNLVFVGEDY